jgi:hypothetical protein
VYLFREGRASQKALLGGKGANLCEMTRLGLPVPPGFVVSTESCNAALAAGALPKGLWSQVLAALKDLEAASGRAFGDPLQPLLVSCRSGAKFSMPGMMDTVLNLGLNDAVATALSSQPGRERFAFDAYRRLVQMFATVVLGLDRQPFEDELAAQRRRAGVENDSGLRITDKRNKAGNRALDPASSPEFCLLPHHAAPRFLAASRNSCSFSVRRDGTRGLAAALTVGLVSDGRCTTRPGHNTPRPRARQGRSLQGR